MIFIPIALIIIGVIFLFFPRANAYFLLFLLVGGGCSSVGATMMNVGVRKPFYPSHVSVRAYSSRYKPYVPTPSDYYGGSSGSDYYGGSYGGGGYGSSSRGYSGGGLSGGK